MALSKFEAAIFTANGSRAARIMPSFAKALRVSRGTMAVPDGSTSNACSEIKRLKAVLTGIGLVPSSDAIRRIGIF